MKALAKVIAVGRTDGLANTLNYLWRGLTTACALRCSETLFLRRSAAAAPAVLHAGAAPEFVAVSDAPSLERYAYPRLAYVPYRKWLSQGSVCFLGLVQGAVVSYCWVHRGSYSLGRIGRFGLGEKERWMGPVFVDKRYRRRGINTAQVHHALRESSHAGEIVFFTATNAANYRSLQSFARCGFVLIGLCRVRMLGPRRISHITCDLSGRGWLKEALA